MNNSNIFRFSWLGFGSIGILLTIITFFTVSTLNKQEESLNLLLAERGTSFIDVYEKVIVSSVYSGLPLDLKGLSEKLTGSQSFKYTMVVDEEGVILLHTDQEQIGKKINLENYFALKIDIKDMDTQPHWQVISYENQDDMIVYKRFVKPRRVVRQSLSTLFPLPTFLENQQNQQNRIERQNERQNDRQNDRQNERQSEEDNARRFLNPREHQNFVKNLFTSSFIFNAIDENELMLESLNEYMMPIPSLNPVSLALSQRKEIYLFVAQDMGLHNQSRLNSRMMIIFASLLISSAAIILIIVLQYVVRNEAIQSRQAEKLLAIGDLTAGVAHEIRNPLSSIKGYATFFKQKFPEGSTEQEAASIMADEVDRLNRAIDNLVGLSRSIDIILEKANITEICTKICLLLDSETRQRGIDFQYPDQNTPEIIASIDPDKLKQALLNLLLNAMESFDNTEISEKKISLSIAKKNKQVNITISDNGAGIAKEIRDRIFDPYFTTKNQGTGLGLVMVKNTIEAHNGSLEVVNNNDNAGTIFIIHLPIV